MTHDKQYIREYMRKWRVKNRKKIRAYNREYNRLWRGRFGFAAGARYAKVNRVKIRAEALLQYHVKMGHVKKRACEVCGSRKSQGHHSDYTKPLKVRWLCALHHRAVHMRRYPQPKI